jgi:hypothetical protein
MLIGHGVVIADTVHGVEVAVVATNMIDEIEIDVAIDNELYCFTNILYIYIFFFFYVHFCYFR